LTGIAPILAPLAATGLAALQVGAIIFHGGRKEFKQWPVNILLLLLAALPGLRRLRRLGRLTGGRHAPRRRRPSQ